MKPNPSLLAVAAAAGVTAGCVTAAPPLPKFWPTGQKEPSVAPENDDLRGRVATADADPAIRQVGTVDPDDVQVPETLSERAGNTARNLFKAATGRETDDLTAARQFYKAGDSMFREATAMSDEDGSPRRRRFRDAAKQFQKSAEAAEGSALEQDALMMRAESLFFADRLTAASEVYEKLQKDFPRNRHNDRIAARQFAISRYWIEHASGGADAWYKINFTDATRPRMDIDGHAVRVLDQIRYDDPTGKLADDATMAAAAELIRQGKFEEADEFLTDLRETFGDSEHQFLAHMLGIRCKLQIDSGPNYSGLALQNAAKLIERTKKRFARQLEDPKYADMIARASAEVEFKQAERLASSAAYREKRREYRAAMYYHQKLVAEFGQTPQAAAARARLAELDKLPAVPAKRLAWLTDAIPESNKLPPVQMKPGADSEAGTAAPGNDTILR